MESAEDALINTPANDTARPEEARKELFYVELTDFLIVSKHAPLFGIQCFRKVGKPRFNSGRPLDPVGQIRNLSRSECSIWKLLQILLKETSPLWASFI